MSRNWYRIAKECVALRKHMLRVDLRVYIDSEESFSNVNDLDSTIKSIITAAVVKGLDVVGIVNNKGPSVGWRAYNLAKSQNLDLFIIPGEEYRCSDSVMLLVFLLKESMPPNLDSMSACKHAHEQGGFVMMTSVGKRKSAEINKLKGQPTAPDAVEIYCAKLGGYQDIFVDFPRFITSGAAAGNDLESLNVFTLINRKSLEGMGLLPEGEGAEYTPNYLAHDDQLQQGASPSDVAEGNVAPVQQPQQGAK